LIRAWASGHIRKNQTLAVSGPYAYTRNPLYLGSLILGVGFCIASGVWWLALGFGALFLGSLSAGDARRSRRFNADFSARNTANTREMFRCFFRDFKVGKKRAQNSISGYTCDTANTERLWGCCSASRF
jgi:hypothetical protein